jgi:hypothetical protein
MQAHVRRMVALHRSRGLHAVRGLWQSANLPRPASSSSLQASGGGPSSPSRGANESPPSVHTFQRTQTSRRTAASFAKAATPPPPPRRGWRKKSHATRSLPWSSLHRGEQSSEEADGDDDDERDEKDDDDTDSGSSASAGVARRWRAKRPLSSGGRGASRMAVPRGPIASGHQFAFRQPTKAYPQQQLLKMPASARQHAAIAAAAAAVAAVKAGGTSSSAAAAAGTTSASTTPCASPAGCRSTSAAQQSAPPPSLLLSESLLSRPAPLRELRRGVSRRPPAFATRELPWTVLGGGAAHTSAPRGKAEPMEWPPSWSTSSSTGLA